MPRPPDDVDDDVDPDDVDPDDLDEDLDDDLDDEEYDDPPGRRRSSPARRATLTAIPAAIIAGLIVFLLVRANLPDPKPPANTEALDGLSVTEVDGTADTCANLVEGLPQEIDGVPQRAVTGHPGSLAWGEPPIVLVCGVAKPEGLDPSATLNVVNNVTWKVDSGVDTSAYGLPGQNTLWTAVDREVYIAVAVPADLTGGTAVSPISTVVDERLPSVEGQ